MTAGRGRFPGPGGRGRGLGRGAVQKNNQRNFGQPQHQNNMKTVEDSDGESTGFVRQVSQDRVVTQQSSNRIVTQNKQQANTRLKTFASKSIAKAKATNIINLRKVKAGDGTVKTTPGRVVVQNTSNRTVIATTKKVQIVCISNLSASTSQVQIAQLCRNIGEFESIQIDQATKKAFVKFKKPEYAVMFMKKYNRHMLDLSHINVSLVK